MDTFVKKNTKSFHNKKNVSTLSKTDGLIRCATYNMAGNLSQQPGDRKRKSPRPQNRYRSEIWGQMYGDILNLTCCPTGAIAAGSTRKKS